MEKIANTDIYENILSVYKNKIRSCLNDTCTKSCPTGVKCGCASLREYVSNCAKKGVKIHWGEHRHCTGKKRIIRCYVILRVFL